MPIANAMLLSAIVRDRPRTLAAIFQTVAVFDAVRDRPPDGREHPI
jgi:hypothetical protein